MNIFLYPPRFLFDKVHPLAKGIFTTLLLASTMSLTASLMTVSASQFISRITAGFVLAAFQVILGGKLVTWHVFKKPFLAVPYKVNIFYWLIIITFVIGNFIWLFQTISTLSPYLFNSI